MRGIEVHYQKPDGRTGVINYLTYDNTEVSMAKEGERSTKRNRLYDRASKYAAAWGEIFPRDRIFVADMAAEQSVMVTHD